MSNHTPEQKASSMCQLGTWIGVVGIVLVAFSAGHRLGFLPSWQIAMMTYTAGSVVLIVAVITLGIGLMRTGGSAGTALPAATWVAFLAGLLVTGNNVIQLGKAFGGPRAPIHDITTDMANPPAFVELVAVRERAGAANPPEYGGATVAEIQERAYPDLRTIVLESEPDEVFRRAVAAAQTLGWEIVATAPAEGRLEATATTLWFGFHDDVVVRIAAGETGTRVDVRSKSRVGMGDMGANADRIREFRDLLRGTTR